MAFKKNGPGCCCGGAPPSCGAFSCSGGNGDFNYRITLSGTPVDLGVNCPTVLTSGCTLPGLSYTANFEFDCYDNEHSVAAHQVDTNCGTCSGGFLAVEIRQSILLLVGLARDPLTSVHYDGVVAVLQGAHTLRDPSPPSNCPTNTGQCDDYTEITYNFPFTYNSGESGFASSPNNCPTGFGTAIGATTRTATDNAIDVTGMSMSITYF